MENVEDGLYQYSFEEPAGGLTYTYYVEWVYGGETYRDTKTYEAELSSVFHASANSMSKNDMVDWIKTEFQPLTLATPDDTVKQIIDNAVRFWNTHSAYDVYMMIDAPASGHSVQLNAQIKMVAEVLPSKTSTWIFNNHPLWTITGIQVLDNITGDMIMMSEAFRNYHVYIGSDMRWHFVKSTDPAQGGYLYMENIPNGSSMLCVRGTKRILAADLIKDECIMDWILNYSIALLKQREGNTLRKVGVADIPNDGDILVKEGKEEQKDLIQQLKEEGRWLAFARRA
jgi:hypothetical protein